MSPTGFPETSVKIINLRLLRSVGSEWEDASLKSVAVGSTICVLSQNLEVIATEKSVYNFDISHSVRHY